MPKKALYLMAFLENPRKSLINSNPINPTNDMNKNLPMKLDSENE